MSHDFSNKTLLSECYDEKYKGRYHKFVDKIISYLVETPSFDNNHQDILMKSFWDVLDDRKQYEGLVEFFKLKK